MVGSKCDLKMHVRNLGLYPFSLYKSGAQKPCFWQFRNLSATFTAYIYGMKYDIHKHFGEVPPKKCLDKTLIVNRHKPSLPIVSRHTDCQERFKVSFRPGKRNNETRLADKVCDPAYSLNNSCDLPPTCRGFPRH